MPAAVAQVSMAAAIRRQQRDGKVRNFFNIGSSKAGVLRHISALQSQLLLKNLYYCRGRYSEEASHKHSRERGTSLVLEGHDLCLSLKPKWHSKFQNIKRIQITSFISNKTVVKLSLLLILHATIKF